MEKFSYRELVDSFKGGLSKMHTLKVWHSILSLNVV